MVTEGEEGERRVVVDECDLSGKETDDPLVRPVSDVWVVDGDVFDDEDAPGELEVNR